MELPPLPDVRRVVLTYPRTKEVVDVIYFYNGDYDRDAMARISHLLRDRRTGEERPIDPLLMDFLFDLLMRTGLSPTTVVEVTDGFRSAGTWMDFQNSVRFVVRSVQQHRQFIFFKCFCKFCRFFVQFFQIFRIFILFYHFI